MDNALNKCPKCFTVLSSWKETICTRCGFDKKNNIDTWHTGDFNEDKLPFILLTVGFLLTLGSHIYLHGLDQVLPLIFMMNVVLFVKIPIMIGFMMLIGKMFSIDFGSVSTGMTKLAGLSLVSSGLNSLATAIDDPIATGGILLFSTITYVALFIGLFNLSFFEALKCWFGFMLIGLILQLVLFVFAVRG